MSETAWIQAAVITLVTAMFFYVLRGLTRKRLIWEVGWFALLLSFLSLISVFVVRSQQAHYFALSNMYESMLALAVGMMLGFLALDRWFRLSSLGWGVCLMLLVIIGYAVTLPTNILPLQAALQSYWRAIHVPVIISSYGLFTLAFISSIVFLIKSYCRKDPADQRPIGRQGYPGMPLLAVETSAMDGLDNEFPGETTDGITMEGTQLYDEISYRCIAFGFPLLAIGIILGGMWANEAWGNYWSWDPKESMSLVTLLGYGVYLHMRVNGEHSPRLLAWVSVTGFILMMVTYFGVNLMGVGLHSYGHIG